MLIGIIIAGMVAGMIYVRLPGMIPYLEKRQTSLVWVLAAGLAVRLLMMAPEPYYEIDYFRYLWDGSVILSGHSPYQWSPKQVMGGEAASELVQLAQSAESVIGQINYPHLTTIYPPVAEAAFALAGAIDTWSLAAWRAVILVCEGITVFLLFALLRHFSRSSLWVIVYWWNPIVIVEFSNAAHMDAILLPFLVGAVLLVLKQPSSYAGYVCLAFASAVKLWPALLFPTLIRPRLRDHRFVLSALLIFTTITGFLLWPLFSSAMSVDSGLRNYSLLWERNAAIFHGLLTVTQSVLDSLSLYTVDAGRLVRTVTGLAIVILALTLNFRAPGDQETLIRRLLIVVTAMLMLGPTLYPWYYAWLVPFLVIIPSRALMAFSIVLPLYRLQFHPWFLEHPWIFDNTVVWLEQGPILILLLAEWLKFRRKERPPLPSMAVRSP